MTSNTLAPDVCSVTRLETSESVCAGHPDKVCDRISDEILDACLREDPAATVNGGLGSPSKIWTTEYTPDATAVRVIGGKLASGETSEFTVELELTGAKNKDLLVNKAVGRAENTQLRMRTSSSLIVLAEEPPAPKPPQPEPKPQPQPGQISPTPEKPKPVPTQPVSPVGPQSPHAQTVVVKPKAHLARTGVDAFGLWAAATALAGAGVVLLLKRKKRF